MKDVTLVCVDAGGGHACGLSLGLRKYCNLTTVWLYLNLHGLDSLDPDALIGIGNLPLGGDTLIIVSNITQDHLEMNLSPQGYRKLLGEYNEVKVIVTDGMITLEPGKYNAKMEGMDVFATVCKIGFRGDRPTKEYFQPFDLSHIDVQKNKIMTIAHSPFGDNKRVQKGTDEIEEGVEKMYGDSVILDVINGVSWDKACERKAKAHLFIDQLYNPLDIYGVSRSLSSFGKSGVEAMHLDSLVFTRGVFTQRVFPIPPCVWIGNDNFIDLVDYYVQRPDELALRVQAQKEWVLKYATHDAMAKHVLGI